MSNILVTGATGFVGSALCQRLAHEGHVVTCALRKETDIPHCKNVIIGDIHGETDWQNSLAGIDHVIHLAARVHVMNDTCDDPLAAFRHTNRDGTRQLAKAAAQAGVKRFIFLSSIKVNGESTEGRSAFSEQVDLPPVDPYGLSKYEAEQTLKEIAAKSDMGFTILRPPLVYGPGVKANFQALLRLSTRNLPVPFGCLNNQRSLVFIKNLVDAMIMCLGNDAAKNKTFLVCDNESLAFKDLYSLICAKNGFKAKLIPIPVSIMRFLGKITGKTAAISRLSESLVIDRKAIEQALNWQAPYSVEQGIEETVKSSGRRN